MRCTTEILPATIWILRYSNLVTSPLSNSIDFVLMLCRRIQCFINCLLEQMNIVKRGKLNYRVAVRQINLFMPDEMKELYLHAVEECKDSGKTIHSRRSELDEKLNANLFGAQVMASQISANIHSRWWTVSRRPVNYFFCREFPRIDNHHRHIRASANRMHAHCTHERQWILLLLILCHHCIVISGATQLELKRYYDF